MDHTGCVDAVADHHYYREPQSAFPSQARTSQGEPLVSTRDLSCDECAHQVMTSAERGQCTHSRVPMRHRLLLSLLLLVASASAWQAAAVRRPTWRSLPVCPRHTCARVPAAQFNEARTLPAGAREMLKQRPLLSRVRRRRRMRESACLASPHNHRPPRALPPPARSSVRTCTCSSSDRL